MIVVVSKKGVKVKAHGKYHSLGESVNELTEAEAKRLVDGGACEYAPSPFVPHDSTSDFQTHDVEENAEEVKVDEQQKVPETGAKIKSATSKKSKVDTETPEDINELGPDTSHPLG